MHCNPQMEKEKLTVSFRTQRNFLKEMALDLSCKSEQADFKKIERTSHFLHFERTQCL